MNKTKEFSPLYECNKFKRGGIMETLKKICLVLIIIGAINWALVGLFEVDLVASLFGGSDELLARLVYIIIGIAGLIDISILFDRLDHHN